MPNTWDIIGTDTSSDIVSSVFGGLGHIGLIFGQVLFVCFWLTLIGLILGAAFLIWLNFRHARECDIQDSQETRAADLLRELAPPDQRFSIVDGRAVKYRGQIPELEVSRADTAEMLNSSNATPSSAVESVDEASVLASNTANQEEPQVDERLKYAPPIGASAERTPAENIIEKEAKS
jgi:hypothetical protein